MIHQKLIIIDSSKLLQEIYTENFNVDKYDIFMATPKLIVTYCKKYGFDRLNKILIFLE